MPETKRAAAFQWHGLTDELKQPFRDRSKIDFQRYQRQIKEFNSNGFFSNDDGSNAFITEKNPKRKYGPDVMLPNYPKCAYAFFLKQNFKSLMG